MEENQNNQNFNQEQVNNSNQTQAINQNSNSNEQTESNQNSNSNEQTESNQNNNSPQEEVGAGKPKPRKSRETNEPILATTANGANEITGVKAFGSMCLNMIVASVQPIALAA